jgi:hypothetical protein
VKARHAPVDLPHPMHAPRARVKKTVVAKREHGSDM